MSSKRRIRRKTCKGKVRHATRDFALLALRKIVSAMGGAVGHLSAYQCPFCSGWHVGHTPGQRTRSRA